MRKEQNPRVQRGDIHAGPSFRNEVERAPKVVKRPPPRRALPQGGNGPRDDDVPALSGQLDYGSLSGASPQYAPPYREPPRPRLGGKPTHYNRWPQGTSST